MQDQMKQPPLYALVPVPYEALMDAGIEPGKLLQFTVDEGKITMEQLVPEGIEIVCSGNCQDCPMLLRDCIGGCKACPCKNNCERSEVR